jgi:hypothetical protein
MAECSYVKLFVLSVSYAECCNVLNAECHYAECRGAHGVEP